MLHKITQRLIYVNHLIKSKSTGTPKQLAKKLGLSERGWFKFRDELVNDLELPIAYCNYRKTYYYTTSGSFEMGFRKLNESDTHKLIAGRSYIAPSQINVSLFTSFHI
jgi:hypothetical protein